VGRNDGWILSFVGFKEGGGPLSAHARNALLRRPTRQHLVVIYDDVLKFLILFVTGVAILHKLRPYGLALFPEKALSVATFRCPVALQPSTRQLTRDACGKFEPRLLRTEVSVAGKRNSEGRDKAGCEGSKTPLQRQNLAKQPRPVRGNSADTCWRSKPHSSIGKLCKMPAARAGPPCAPTSVERIIEAAIEIFAVKRVWRVIIRYWVPSAASLPRYASAFWQFSL
jgi:hypothetical protein